MLLYMVSFLVGLLFLETSAYIYIVQIFDREQGSLLGRNIQDNFDFSGIDFFLSYCLTKIPKLENLILNLQSNSVKRVETGLLNQEITLTGP